MKKLFITAMTVARHVKHQVPGILLRYSASGMSLQRVV